LCSDFDNTIVKENTAAKLVLFYLWHGQHEPFLHRARRVLPLMTSGQRRKHFDNFYEVLKRVSLKNRQRILAAIPINVDWLEAVRMLRLKHKCRDVELTIVSRNCVDVLKEWLLMNQEIMQQHHIRVHLIIANKPALDRKDEFVQGNFHHIDHAGLGVLLEEGKQQFVKHSIYIGDYEEELLRPFVREFVRV
jgi:hypothetical protein